MPLPPSDQPTSGRPANPARVLMESPRAATAAAIVYRRRNRERPRERGLRVLAIVGSLLVHLVFLFGFVLGPAYQVVPRPAPKEQFVQVRLIETPQPPPPPPPRGTPPKELGPRHQGHAGQPVSNSERATSMSTPSVAPPSPAAPTAAAAAGTRGDSSACNTEGQTGRCAKAACEPAAACANEATAAHSAGR
jgi:type IV secretory pathway VirB10-like protein